MRSRLTVRSLGFAVVVSLLWIVYSRVVPGIAFSYSGFASGIWFLPAIFAAEIQKSRRVRGLVFFSETLASLIATLGRFGSLSLQFGVVQGLVAEVFCWRKATGFRAGMGALIGDILLEGLHPQLQMFSRLPANVWAMHLAGSIDSVWIVTKLVRGAFLRLFVIAVLLVPTVSRAESCGRLLTEIDHATQGRPFVIAVDYDGTIVDTDTFLARDTIPKAVMRLLPSVAPSERAAFETYLSHLKDCDAIPEVFDELCWREALWPFPIDALPAELAKRPGLKLGSSALAGFWDLMAEVFAENPRQIDLLPTFVDFHRAVKQRFDGQAEWLVVTARTDGMLSEIPEVLAPLGKFSFETGKSAQMENIPHTKAQQMGRFRGQNGGSVRVFADNDKRNLAGVRRELGAKIVLIQAGRKTFEPWP